MSHRLTSWVLAVASIVAASTGRVSGAELSISRFTDWNAYDSAAWRAVNRGDLVEAARRFQLAIDTLKPEWERCPRLMARSYADLARVLYKQGRATEAEPLARWALAVRVERSGPESENAAQSLYDLALIQCTRANYAEAESLLLRSISAWEKHLGVYDLRVTFYLTELARVYKIQRKSPQAEAIYRRILGRPERALPAKHPLRVVSLIGLGSLYTERGESLRAQHFNSQIESLLEVMPARDYPDVAETLSAYVSDLRQAGQAPEASKLEDRAREILAVIDKGRQDKIHALQRVVQAAQGELPVEKAETRLIGVEAPAIPARESR